MSLPNHFYKRVLDARRGNQIFPLTPKPFSRLNLIQPLVIKTVHTIDIHTLLLILPSKQEQLYPHEILNLLNIPRDP